MALPPGPGLGLLQTLRYVQNPYPVLRGYAARYGDIFTVRTGRTVVMTGRPELIRRIIGAPTEQYGLIKESGSKRVFGTAGMMNRAGRDLRRDRRLIMPQFQGETLTDLGGMMRQATLDAMLGWAPGHAFRMHDEAMTVALDVILRTVFGAQDDAELQAFRDAVRGFSEAFGSKAFLLSAAFRIEGDAWPPYRRLEVARNGLVVLLLRAIGRAREDGRGLLGRLAAARYDDGSGLSDESLVDNLLTTLVAGHETSVLSLCWAMFWLHYHSGCLDRLRAELDTLGGDASPAEVAALPYLDAVVRETLRLWPAVADINRVLAQPMELGGYMLPPGTVVAGATAILHYDPALYPEPERFDPGRFLGRKFAAWEYTPFGGGERMCPGAQFSAFELKIILGTLLRGGRYTLLEDGIPEVKRLGFLMAPKTGVRLRYEGVR